MVLRLFTMQWFIYYHQSINLTIISFEFMFENVCALVFIIVMKFVKETRILIELRRSISQNMNEVVLID